MAFTESEVLAGYAVPSLQQMVKQRQIAPKSQAKQSLVSLLAADLYHADRIDKAVADLAPVERRLLDALILLGGEAPTGLLHRILLGEGLIVEPKREGPWYASGDHKGSPWKRGSQKFEDVVSRLGVLGLVFTGSSPNSTIVDLSAPGTRLFIPEGILARLPRVDVPPVVSAEPSEVAAGDVALVPRDLYLLLGFAESTPLALTTRGQIVKRSLVAIDGTLRVSENAAAARSEDDLPRFSLLRALAEDLGLLAVRNNTLVAEEGNSDEFLGRAPGERLTALYRRYRATDRWCELAFVDGLAITRRSGAGRGAPPPIIAARERVIAEIASLPSGEWIPLAHLIDRLKRTAYEFLIPRPRLPYVEDHYYYTNPYAGENPLGWIFNGILEPTGWEQVEGRLIRRVVDVLHWLGLVDLGIRNSQPTDFRINAFGVRLFRGEAVSIELPPPRVVVQPNYQIFAFEPIDEAVLHQIDRIAERVRTESAIEYRLTQAAVYRAQQRGVTADEILDRLQGLSAVPLPQNVRRTVEEWGERHERIVVRRGVGLLRTTDKGVLDELAADPRVGPLLGRRVGRTTALVPIAHLETVYRALLDAQRLPALSEGVGVPPGPQVTVAATGEITFRSRLPNLFVLRELRAFAEETEGKYRLSRDSLRRAARSGLSAEEIIVTIENLQGERLSSETADLIRRWAKNWGTGVLAEAMLLQVETPEILESLLAVSEVRRHLQPIPGAPTLAIVRPDSIDRLRPLLAERGMELTDRFRTS